MFKGLTDYRPEIEFTARKFDLDPDLVEAVVLTESSGRTDAFRHEPGFYLRYIKGKARYRGMIPRRIASSYGLMQVMPTTAEQYGFEPATAPERLFVPVVGLEYGCRHLAKLLEQTNHDLAKALGAYNAGLGNAMSPAARLYAGKVLRRLEEVRAARRAMSSAPSTPASSETTE